MSELTNGLASALMEERVNNNLVLATMHRVHLRLLDVLGKIEARLEALEAKQREEVLDFESHMDRWMLDHVAELVSTLTHIDEFNTYIERIADDRFMENIGDVSIDIEANIRT